MKSIKFQVYQTYFNELSKSKLDPGFIPYNNTGKEVHNFENDIMKDIYLSKRLEWIDADYTGLLSWRFYEKSKMTSAELFKKVSLLGYPAVSVKLGSNYRNCPHPFVRKQYPEILNMCKVADKYRLFDFNFLNYPAKQVIWCNYWLATPEVFELYCSKYLLKVLAFFGENSNNEAKMAYQSKIHHRGLEYFTMAFFMEGLFSVFLQEEKIDNIQI